jgi:exopolysaccharide biosynthesis WecB/TagA/CpsF family protein
MIFLGKFKIIDNDITACDYEYILQKIREAITRKKKLLISPIASHTLVKAHYDKKLKKILDGFDYLLPDSQWVKRAIWFLYGKRLKERVYGPELMLRVCQLAQDKGLKIFLYGNTQLVLDKLEKKLNNLFPKLKIVGKEESKFRPLTEKEEKELIKKIEKAKPQIIFVCLGSPKQEIFSYHLSKTLKSSVIIIPVGAAFDFIAGAKKQAPRWMGEIGFEWFFRLIHEPKKLWRRYLVDGVLFINLILIKKISTLIKKGQK